MIYVVFYLPEMLLLETDRVNRFVPCSLKVFEEIFFMNLSCMQTYYFTSIFLSFFLSFLIFFFFSFFLFLISFLLTFPPVVVHGFFSSVLSFLCVCFWSNSNNCTVPHKRM